MLARAYDSARGALECDLREVYGLDLNQCGEEYSLLHASRLVGGLRAGSRTLEALGIDSGWSRSELLGAALFDELGLLMWGLANAGAPEHMRTPRPTPVFPGPKGEQGAGGSDGFAPDELMERLGYKAVS